MYGHPDPAQHAMASNDSAPRPVPCDANLPEISSTAVLVGLPMRARTCALEPVLRDWIMMRLISCPGVTLGTVPAPEASIAMPETRFGKEADQR
jgi:hypothetical protein